MKNLLATTALVTALIATPAAAEKYVLDANGDFYDREMVHYAHGPVGDERLVVLTSDNTIDLDTYGDTTTIVRLNDMTEDDIRSDIGDLNRDGVIDEYDVSIYVGDNNNDGVIDHEDYENRFGEDMVIIEQSSNLDGSTTIATTQIKKDFVPQNEGSSMETRTPYGDNESFAANEPVIEYGDEFVQQNEGSSIETRTPEVYGSVDVEDDYNMQSNSELSLWERFKANFE